MGGREGDSKTEHSFIFLFLGWGTGGPSYCFTFYIEFTNPFLVFLQMEIAQNCGGSDQECWGAFLEGACVLRQTNLTFAGLSQILQRDLRPGTCKHKEPSKQRE